MSLNIKVFKENSSLKQVNGWEEKVYQIKVLKGGQCVEPTCH